jgi:hypothetical protein
VYSLLGVSADPLHDHGAWGPVGGAGVRVPVGPVAVLGDGLAHSLFFGGLDEQALLAQARLRVSVPVAARIELSAGATWNVFASSDDDGAALPLGLDRVAHHGDTVVRQWPGLAAGAAVTY